MSTPQEEEFLYRDTSRLQAGAQMTTVTMARRLPALVLRSLKMAWRVDRVATAGLLACQVGTGMLAALGLLAVTGTLTALISSGDISDRLWEAAPQLAVIAVATGLRALLGITVTWLTGRLRPFLARAAELTMIEAALGAELAANNQPGYNDFYDLQRAGVGALSGFAAVGRRLRCPFARRAGTPAAGVSGPLPDRHARCAGACYPPRQEEDRHVC